MEKEKVYFLVMLAVVLTNILYWSVFVIEKYEMFRYPYSDFGFYSYNFYYLVNYPRTMLGLQYLVIGNHVAPDQLLVVPFYYLLQSPFTPLIFQVVVVSITGLLLFFIAKKLLKNGTLAFILGLAFLLNPGVQGLIVFDYHPEFFILPFYLLTFYFYFTRNRPLFFASLILLLGTLDSVVFITAALGVGLFYYETFYEKSSKVRSERRRLAAYIIAFSIIALIVYSGLAAHLIDSYATGYTELPAIFRAFQFDLPVLYKLVPSNIAQFAHTTINPIWFSFQHFDISQYQFLVAFGLVVALFAFGMLALNDPVLILILDSPWLVAFLGFGYLVYGSVNYQYFSYVIGGSAVAAILGGIMMRGNRGMLLVAIRKLSGWVKENREVFVYSSILIVVLYASGLGAIFHFSAGPVFLVDFRYNTSCYSQLNSVIDRLPANGSVMTESSIYPHIYREDLEAMTSYNLSVYFKPDYILVDFNRCINSTEIDVPQEYAIFQNYTSRSNYSVYLRNGSATIYRLS